MKHDRAEVIERAVRRYSTAAKMARAEEQIRVEVLKVCAAVAAPLSDLLSRLVK